MGPARFHCATLLLVMEEGKIWVNKKQRKKYLSEVGFEPTPTEVDCDLNAAP